MAESPKKPVDAMTHAEACKQAYTAFAMEIMKASEAEAMVLVIKNGVYGNCAIAFCPSKHAAEFRDVLEMLKGTVGGTDVNGMVDVSPDHVS